MKLEFPGGTGTRKTGKDTRYDNVHELQKEIVAEAVRAPRQREGDGVTRKNAAGIETGRESGRVRW